MPTPFDFIDSQQFEPGLDTPGYAPSDYGNTNYGPPDWYANGDDSLYNVDPSDWWAVREYARGLGATLNIGGPSIVCAPGFVPSPDGSGCIPTGSIPNIPSGCDPSIPWCALGYPNKQAWKQAGRPAAFGGGGAYQGVNCPPGTVWTAGNCTPMGIAVGATGPGNTTGPVCLGLVTDPPGCPSTQQPAYAAPGLGPGGIQPAPAGVTSPTTGSDIMSQLSAVWQAHSTLILVVVAGVILLPMLKKGRR